MSARANQRSSCRSTFHARTYAPLRPWRRATCVSIEFISVESTLDATRTLLIAATSSRAGRARAHRDAPDPTGSADASLRFASLRLPVTYACIICYGFHTSHNSTDISTPPPPPPRPPTALSPPPSAFDPFKSRTVTAAPCGSVLPGLQLLIRRAFIRASGVGINQVSPVCRR